ncbi:MAG: restriction endonuclease [Candidatus Heimdallarchaeota archaeon]|nr:MAG: restriction endonuclease [Candidatus Heimdallarchaeota archaeon]
MQADFINKPLNDLVLTVFAALEFVTLHPMQVLKHPLADSRLSYVVKRVKHNPSQKKSEFIGVIIRDWKRVVGVGQIHKAEELLQACPKLSRVLIISSMGFSYSAKRLADKVGIGLMSRGELVSLLQKRVEVL